LIPSPGKLFFCLLLAAGLNGCAYHFTSLDGVSIFDCPTGDVLDSAVDAYESGDFEDAAHLASFIVDERPDSVEAEDALFFAAEASLRDEEPKKAFLFYKELILRFPATRRSRIVAERDFSIGEAFFTEGTGFFGFLKVRGYGVRVMNHLLDYFPTSDLADDAQMAIGEYYFSREDFTTAAESYEQVLEAYPLSEWAERAVFLTGKSYFRLNKGYSYDREFLLRSIQYLRHYLDRYPEGTYLEECKWFLADAGDRMARKELEIATFYLDQDQERGGRIHLSNVVLLFPETDASDLARTMLEERGWDTSIHSCDTVRPRKLMSEAGR
jgi:outer membrane protein assembly factor BamD (BamD/ComL family)